MSRRFSTKCITSLVLSWTLALYALPGPAFADEKLDQLLADYKAYGLPLPAEGAELAILLSSAVSYTNGVRHQDMYLTIVQTEVGNKRTYWAGFGRIEQWEGHKFKPVTLKTFNLKDTVPLPRNHVGHGFSTISDLALAVQCHALGHKELAADLLARSRELGSDSYDRYKPRPLDDRGALAELTWKYLCNRFNRVDRAERLTIIAQMKHLTTTPYQLNTTAHRHLIADMEKTVVEVKTEPDSLEAALEGLLTYRDTWTTFAGSGWDDTRHNLSQYPPFLKLQKAGLQAVPLLLKHLDDFRLTRRIQVDKYGSYAWHIRVADMVALLLNGIANERFAYDFLEKEGRGVRLDRRHVENWWKGINTGNELEILVKSLDKAGGGPGAESTLTTLGAKYPEELVKLFEKRLKENTLGPDWIEALGHSKAKLEDKHRLLLLAAASKDEWHQIESLRVLSHMKHPKAPELVIAILEKQPTTAKDVWKSNFSSFVQIGYGMDDDAVWKVLLKTAKRVDLKLLMEMIGTFGMGLPGPTHERAIAFLKEFLEDKEGRKGGFGRLQELLKDPEARKTLQDPERLSALGLFDGPKAGGMYEDIRVCDLATEQLARLLDMKIVPNSEWKSTDWDKLRKSVLEELAKRKPGSEGKKP